jgi:hypothetical protein
VYTFLVSVCVGCDAYLYEEFEDGGRVPSELEWPNCFEVHVAFVSWRFSRIMMVHRGSPASGVGGMKMMAEVFGEL